MKEAKQELSPTEVAKFLGDLSAGQVEAALAHTLSRAALGAVSHGRQGEVILRLRFNRVGEDGRQVSTRTKVSYVQPTLRGKKAEDFETQTQMYVNQGGNLSLFPETQGDFFESMTSPKPAREES